ncbi:MAG: YihY/virulence factor BrkB family protein [Dehalococcoidia bacterium]|nr:YihY/virulence factor BrkB family protein [Dehalococcoidia bacterium]
MANWQAARARRRHPPLMLAARILRRATINFTEDRCTQMAAAISYFALFSLFPLTLLAVSIFGIVLRNAAVQGRVLQAIVDLLPIEATSIESSLRAVAHLGPTLTVVSLAGALWTAGALSAAVRHSLDVAFDARRGRPYLRGKLIDYALLPGLGLLLLASFALTAAWRVAQARADALPWLGGELRWLWDLGALTLPALISFAMFLFLYWLLPNTKVRVQDAWPGALLAALGFEALKHGFATYLAYFAAYNVVYGSLGGVIALLLWIYLSANILLFGAEVAAEVPHVLAEEPRHGHAGATEAGWRRSLVALLRGLVLRPEQDAAAPPSHGPGERTRAHSRRDRGDLDDLGDRD